MNVYKVELMVLDFDDIGADEIKGVLENTRYDNDCMTPSVMACDCRDIGEWSDEHKLNYINKKDAEYRRLFGKQDTTAAELAQVKVLLVRWFSWATTHGHIADSLRLWCETKKLLGYTKGPT